MCRGHRSLQGRQPSCQHLPGAYRGSGRFWQGAGVHAKANAIRRDPTVPPALLCPALSCITSLENRGDTGQKIGVPACAPSLSPHVPATPLHIQHPMPLAKAQHPAPQQPHGEGQGPPISKAHPQHARAPPGHSRPLTSRAAAWRGRRRPGLCTSLPKRCRQPQALCTPGGGDAGGCPSAAEP